MDVRKALLLIRLDVLGRADVRHNVEAVVLGRQWFAEVELDRSVLAIPVKGNVLDAEPLEHNLCRDLAAEHVFPYKLVAKLGHS